MNEDLKINDSLTTKSIFKSELAKKQLIGIIVFSSIITLLGTGLQLFNEYKADVHFVEQQFEKIKSAHLKTLTKSVFDFDEIQINTQLNSILSLRDIIYIEITKHEKIIHSAGKPTPHSRKKSIRYRLTHDYNNEKIDLGEVTITATFDGIFQRMQNRVIIILITQGIKTFLVSLFILFIIHYIVIRHLRTISGYIRTIQFDSTSNQLILDKPSPRHSKPDEIDILVHGINKMHQRITDGIRHQKKLESVLQKSEERFRAIYENAPVLIDAFDETGRCVLWNHECQKTFGWTIEEINAHGDALSLFYPDPIVREEVIHTVTNDPDAHFREWHPITKDGKILDTMWANFKLPDGLTFNLGYDITERKAAENTIRKSLEEKVILLKEIHHRVKNNLQMIESLINLQLSETSNQNEFSVVEDSKNRIRSMALVHETLYRSNNFSRINIEEYIVALIDPLFASMKPSDSTIHVTYMIKDILIDIDTTIACGLIINELVVNSLKHAFINNATGNINIEVQCDADDHAIMVVSDDGIGMPPENYHCQKNTLGLKIVKLMAEKQLEAVVALDCKKGTLFKFSFPIKKGGSNESAY